MQVRSIFKAFVNIDYVLIIPIAWFQQRSFKGSIAIGKECYGRNSNFVFDFKRSLQERYGGCPIGFKVINCLAIECYIMTI